MSDPIPLEADLGIIEDYAGVDLDVVMTTVLVDLPVEQVATRQAGYSIDDWVPIEGVPLGMTPTARTGVSISGYTATPGFGPDPAVVKVPCDARWLPKDYEPGIWRGSGRGAFEFTTSGDPPALLNDDYAYTVNGRWYSAQVVDFAGDEALIASVPAASSLGFVVVATVYRRPESDTPSYGILEMTQDEEPTQPNVHLGLRCTGDDRLQVFHLATPVTTAVKTTDQDEVVVLGMWTDDSNDLLTMTMNSHGQAVRRETYSDPSVPTIAVGGKLYLGRSSGKDANFAVMRVMDLAMAYEKETYLELVKTMTTMYVAGRGASHARS